LFLKRRERSEVEHAQQAKEKGIPTPLKVPPQNVEAEQTILAGVLINNDALNQIVDVLSPEDFYREGHTCLYEGMIELYNNNEPIDLITLPQSLREKGLLEKAGGMDYLASLADAVSTSAGILFHAQIVRDLSVRRKLISQCSVISEACFQSWEPTEELLEMAEQSIFDIAEDKIGETFSTLEEVIKGSFKKLESVAEHEGFVTGVPTDSETWTVTPPACSLGSHHHCRQAEHRKNSPGSQYRLQRGSGDPQGVVVFSLEMAKMQLGMRLLGFQSGIDATKLRTGFLRDSDWHKLTESANQLSELPVFIDDTSNLSALEMKAKCRRLMKKRDLALVIIDYLQLMQGRRNAESRQMEISEISRSLKALAKDLNVRSWLCRN